MELNIHLVKKIKKIKRGIVMSDKYEVSYFNHHSGKYISVGYYHWFFKAKRIAKKLSKQWYCVKIEMRLKKV